MTSTADITAADGRCTLREAIVAANTDAGTGGSGECAAGDGADRIHFDLTGDGDYEIDGHHGFAIRPTSELPSITAPLTIDGYTQPGAAPNSARSPRPLDGRLLVQLQGSAAGDATSGLEFAPGSDRSTVRGLVIGGFGGSGEGNGVVIDADGVALRGNYIGTDPTGTVADGNTFAGFTTSSRDHGRDQVIGGTRPEDRNLISGNGSSAGYPHPGASIQGNYIGTDVSGARALPNAVANSAGALSIDLAPNVLVGGEEVGAANVISGNASMGVAPDVSPHLVVAGNLIGTDWTGTLAVPNEAGVALSGDQDGSIIGGDHPAAANIISGNSLAGVVDGSTGRLRIIGNTVGLDAGGAAPLSNAVGVALRSGAVVGGSASARNVISGNSAVNVMIRGAGATASGARIIGNLIGTDASGSVTELITAAQGAGVWIAGDAAGNVIGGDVGNRIAGNRGFGVGVSSYADVVNPATSPLSNLIVGNEIFSTTPGPAWPGAPGSAIDLFAAIDSTEPFHPLDASPEQVVGLGADATAGSSAGLLGGHPATPTVETAMLADRSIIMTVDLGPSDARDRYRIDVYLNVATDRAAARTPVGHAVVGGPGVHTVELSLPGDVDAAGTWVTASATRLDGSGPRGSTGELSESVPLTGS